MRYFVMLQDNKYSEKIELKKILNEIEVKSVIYIDCPKYEVPPSFLWGLNNKAVYMISDKFTNILEIYEEELITGYINLIGKDIETVFRYGIINIPVVDAKSLKTEYYPDMKEKHLILDKEKIKNHNIFLLDNSIIKSPIVSLLVVESILRRKMTGIEFREVEVE